ncbi:UNVERIFIED_CONTAM: hypothetical protein FKN15_051875 [Acipenser sinensis]
MVVALVGYLVRVWWIYQIILSLPTFPFLLVCWKLPETPFYLLAKGRYKEAQDLIDKVAEFNGAVELPSYIVGCFAMDKLGRRNTLAPSLILSGTACALIIVVPQNIAILAIILSMTGKFAIAIAFGLIYLYTCELYPTIIRSLAVGSGSMLCRVGSVVAPLCVYLASVWTFLPQVIVGILALLIGMLTLLLPETLGKPLTSTLEEAAALGSKKEPECTQANSTSGEKIEMNPKV